MIRCKKNLIPRKENGVLASQQSHDDRVGSFILKNGRKDNIGKCTTKLRIKVRLNNKKMNVKGRNILKTRKEGRN